MKQSYNSSVLSITHEDLTNFQSLMESNHDSIESLSKVCSKDIDGVIDDLPNEIAA